MRLFFILTFIGFYFPVAGQSLSWAKSFGRGDSPSTINSVQKALTRDAAGNIYTTGSFTSGPGGIDFDPNAGVFNMVSAGGKDVFVSKLDANGNFVWALQIGGGGAQVGEHIALDGLGNIYIAGTFAGTPDFDPGVGIFNITSSGSLDNFIVKLDQTGNFIWAKSIGGSNGNSDNIINSLAVDAVGNVYFTGALDGGGAGAQSFDLDPNVGVFNLTLSITAFANIYAAKWDANGNFVWAKQLVSSVGLGDKSHQIQLDALGNVFIVGEFRNVLDFDPGPGVFNMGVPGTGHAFLWVLSNGGNFIGAREFGGSVANESTIALSFNFDASNNMYITGVFNGTTDFDPSAGIFNLTSTNLTNNSLFILKLNSIGNLLWAKAINVPPGFLNNFIGGVGSVSSCGITIVGTLASFGATIDFDPNIGTFNLTPPGGISPFILQLDPNGNFIYAINSNVIFKSPLEIDAAGNMYGTGTFSGTIDFDLDPNSNFNLTAPAAGNATFVTKLNPYPWSPSVNSPELACLNSTDTISASTILGSAISWHSSSTGGSLIGAGDTLITPVLSDTSTFYVQDSTCQAGPRDSITINTMSCGPLPITLLYFDAFQHGNNVKTEWTTTSEINNDYFTIQRSLDGTHFESIGILEGAGNSTEVLHYQFIDKTLNTTLFSSNIVYYRLKQTDFDGQYEYFDIKAVDFKISTSLENIQIYPNPTSGELFIRLDNEQWNKATIELTDNLGKKIDLNINTQMNKIKLNNDLPKGIYYLKVQLESRSVVKKIIKD